jgi:hypothetical protein
MLRDLKQGGAASLLSKRRGKIHAVQPAATVDNRRLSRLPAR